MSCGTGSGGGTWVGPPTLFAERDHRQREFQLDPAQCERLRLLAFDLTAGARDALTSSAFLSGTMALLVNAAARRKRALPRWLSDACIQLREPSHFRGGTPAFAALAGCSPAHLARSVRRLLQRTPTDLVNEARLTHAAHLLVCTDEPIIEIAAQCGFENLGHFYQLFRARYTTSPRRYRLHAVVPLDRAVPPGAQ